MLQQRAEIVTCLAQRLRSAGPFGQVLDYSEHDLALPWKELLGTAAHGVTITDVRSFSVWLETGPPAPVLHSAALAVVGPRLGRVQRPRLRPSEILQLVPGVKTVTPFGTCAGLDIFLVAPTENVE